MANKLVATITKRRFKFEAIGGAAGDVFLLVKSGGNDRAIPF